jgi:3-dehydroquinate dehydratase II
MIIHIVNGPNLNLLGVREPAIYGSESFETNFQALQHLFSDHQLHYFQSNVEGELINYLQQVGFSSDAIILNAGGYSHTSVAIADAISAIATKVISVHISNTISRESFRHTDIIATKCVGYIGGMGLKGYELAIRFFVS